MNSAKQKLRESIKKAISNLPSPIKCQQSLKVQQKLLEHPKYLSSKQIAVYLSINREINTLDIVKNILGTGKKCFIPKFDTTNRQMEMIQLNSMEEYDNLPTVKWNIKQPADHTNNVVASPQDFDLIIVPGVAFSTHGHRLGNGGGFYDSYLKSCVFSDKKPYLIGLAFNEQKVSDIPIEEHDVVLDEVLFPDF